MSNVSGDKKCLPPTPRTDAALDKEVGDPDSLAVTHLARQLERELAEARESASVYVALAAAHAERADKAAAPSHGAAPVADPVADLCKHIKDSIRLCDHGYIHMTCGTCVASWIPRN